MKSIGIYIILALLLNSCSLFEQEEDIHLSRASATDIKEILIQDRLVQFTLGVDIPTPCHTFNSYKSEKVNGTIQTTIFVKVIPKPCIQIHVNVPFKLNFMVSDPGEYTFSFWGDEGKHIETTVVIE